MLLAVFPLLAAMAPGDSPQTRYIEQYSDLAIAEMQRTGVPASITLAQGLVESAAGQSTLATQANNHFGIKCHRDWKGRTMLRDDDARNECFRAYDTPEESFRDHSDFLRYQDRYKDLFDLKPTDYKGWAKGLKKAGYATDPEYANRLIKVIEDYRLDKFDKGIKVEVEAPSVIEEVHEVVRVKTSVPQYKERVDISLTRPVFERNGSRFILAVEGDTYGSIAAEYGLFFREILNFNDLDDDMVLDPGTEVYIKAKKKQAAPGLDKYVVGSDSETLRGICQRYAVRMSSVRKINGFSSDFEPLEGDTILLRKVRQ